MPSSEELKRAPADWYVWLRKFEDEGGVITRDKFAPIARELAAIAHPAPTAADTGGLVEQEARLQNDREWRAKLDHVKAKLAAAREQIAELERKLESAERMYRSSCSRADHAEAALSSAHETIRAMRDGALPLLGWLEKLEAEFPDTTDDTIVGGVKGITVTFGDLRRFRAALTLAAKEQTDGK